MCVVSDSVLSSSTLHLHLPSNIGPWLSLVLYLVTHLCGFSPVPVHLRFQPMFLVHDDFQLNTYMPAAIFVLK